MKLLTTLKTLPLAGVVALGLALVPAVSMADKGDRGDKGHYSQQGGKSFKADKRSHNDRGNHYGHTKKGHDKYAYNRGGRHQYGHDRRGHGHVHSYGHPVHNHTTTVVHDYGHQHYLGLGNLRFMLGLHTDNVDIIFRD
ncbi:MAG: hypothetical protein WBN96_10895 [Gammaproteobacteria bacterium]